MRFWIVYIVFVCLSLLNDWNLMAQICNPALPFSAALTPNPSMCSGNADGSITVSLTNGVPPFQYSWSSNTGGQTDLTATGLAPGVYSVTVTDDNGCVANTELTAGNCFEITHLFVDACYPADEGVQEFFTFRVGNSPLALSDMNISWPNNSFQGLCNNAALTSAINASLPGPGVVKEPTIPGVLPAGAQVLVFSSTAAASSTVSFPPFTDTLYIVYQCSGNLMGHFSNYNATASVKELIVSFGPTCADTVSYSTDLLVDQSGNPGGENGGAVRYNASGDPTYFNRGCVAPIDSLSMYSSVTLPAPASGLQIDSILVIDPSCGLSNGSISTSVSGGTTPYSYLWAPGNQSDTVITGLISGTYSLTITDANNCETDTLLVLNSASQGISLSVTADQPTCNPGSDGMLTLLYSGGISPYSVLWNDGSTTDAIAGLNPGLYSVTVTDSSGCSRDTSIDLTFENEIILGTPSFSKPLCAGGSDGSIFVPVSGGQAPYIFEWSGSASTQTTANVTGLPAGNYAVTVTESSGCSATSSVVLTDAVPVSVNLAIVDLACPGDGSGSITTTVSGGTPPYTYQWSPNAGTGNNPVANGLMAGTYTLTVSDVKSCKSTYTIVVTQPAGLSLSVTGDTTICPGETINLMAALSGGLAPITYSWDNAQTTAMITVSPNVTTNYAVSVSEGSGCVLRDSVKVSVRGLSSNNIILSVHPPICPGEQGYVFAQYSDSSANVTFSWDHGLGTQLDTMVVTPDTTTIYTVTVTDICGTSLTKSITQSVQPAAVVDLPALLASGCAPVTLDFTDTIQVPNPVYHWDFGDGTQSQDTFPSHYYPNPGSYTVVLTVNGSGACNQQITDSALVIVSTPAGADCEVGPLSTTILNPQISFSSSSNDSLIWLFGDSTFSNANPIVHNYSDTGYYETVLIAYSVDGCTDTCRNTIRISADVDMKVPSAFIPNPNGPSDGVYDPQSLTNDIFFPILRYVLRYEMTIFNRWGEMVFQTTDLSKGWDGYYRGKICQQDTYVWKIVVLFDNDAKSKLERTGSVTLIR